jgi:multiple sugar transport system permease protein
MAVRDARIYTWAAGRRSARAVLARAALYAIAVVAAVVMVFPFYWTVVGSFMTPVELFSSVPHLLPRNPTAETYTRVWQLLPIGRWFVNSLVTSVVTMVVAVLVSSAAGYCFAQLRFAGQGVWFVLILATLMVPYQSRIIPLYLQLHAYGLSNSYLGIVLPGLASALGVFMMTQFFKTVPSELRDAAVMDGASELRVFLQVYMPLARPAVATLALLMFIQTWDQLLWPLIISPQPDMRTLQVGLAYLNQTLPTMNYQMAAIALSVIPVVIVFVLAQRQLIAGIATGALKE